MKKLKTLTTSTAIALASVGVPAFAQEATTTTAVDATAVNEPALVSKPVADAKPEVKKSSDVKPALDAQASTVKQVEAESETAKAEATSANQAVTTTETALTSAKEDLKSAEAVKANATEENITATKAKQDANVKAQEANQKATEASTEAIKAQTETVASETANVASATSKKVEADKTVTAKEANVKSAEDALNGSGLGEAKASLAQAEKDIEQANANISSATTAVETAKKADSNRADAIKQAENNVNVKNDALKLAKEMMDADQNKVESIQEKADATASKEKEAQTALDAQKARSDEAVIHMGNPVHHLTDEEKAYYGLDKNDITFSDASSYYIRNRYKNKGKADELMLTMGVKMNNALKVDFNQNDDNRKVDIDHLTDAEIIEISDFYAKLINALQEKMEYPKNYRAYAAQDTLEHSKKMAKAYEARGTDPAVAGHIRENNGVENLASIYASDDISTMQDLKNAALRAFKNYSFLDKHANWGHLNNNLNGGGVAMTVANINGKRWFVNSFGSDGKHKINLNQDLAQLEAKLAEAQKQNSQAQTALTNAKAELAEASRKYASALEAKTEAEKELASKTASPLQTEVAEKNLQLANLALKNAQERKATAEKAVENFSRSQAEKQTALETAKAELATAKTAQKDAETALTNAQAKVADLEAKLTQAKSAAKLAQEKFDAVTAKLQAEQTKLAEIQEKFDKLLDLENKVKENVVATLPDGTVVAVGSNSNTLPKENTEETADKSKTASQSGKDVTLNTKEDVVVKDKEQTYSAPAVKAGADEKVTYSRVERAKSLPNTGESSSVAMLVLGAILGAFGLVTVRRKN